MNGPDGHSRAAQDRDVPSNRCHKATSDEGSRVATIPPGWWPSKGKGESLVREERSRDQQADPSHLSGPLLRLAINTFNSGFDTGAVGDHLHRV